MTTNQMEKLTLQGLRVKWTNFQGAPGKFTVAGDRNFNLVFDDLALAEEVAAMGWRLRPRYDEDNNILYYTMKVKVNYNSTRPPRIYKISELTQSGVLLTEDEIEMLDYLPIQYVDIIVSPYHWENNGNSGVSAYCQTMYAVIEENQLDIKWISYTTSSEMTDYHTVI